MSIIFILAALGITFFYTNPTYRGSSGNPDISQKSVKELLEDRIRYTAALEKTREIEEVRNGLLTRYNSITDEQREKLVRMIPDNIDSVRLIIDVNNIAAAYSMSMRDISLTEAPVSTARKDSPAAVISSDVYSYVTLNFSLTGTYSNLISFLADLEKSLRVSDIINLNIGASTREVEGPGGVKNPKVQTPVESKYEMKIGIRTYFLTGK
ncbi:MAG TPA: hypothetical protein VJI33_02360 [Candidatus Paceibacterota bacterium]